MNQILPIESFKKELTAQEKMISEVLPQHLSIEKFKRAAVIAVTHNPGILQADQQSLFASLQRCAVDGLVPDNKEAALVEFNTKSGNEWIKKIQYMPMIDGVLKRARQSGEIATITARAVYANDTFDYWVDEDGEHLNHRPNFMRDRGEMSLVYAMAKLKSGEAIVEPMSMDDINRVRASSKTGDKGPWKDWFDRMALKSVMHRLARRLPNSSEIMEMLDRGNFMYDFNNKNEKEINSLSSAQTIGGYSKEAFESKLPEWKALIESGAKTSKQISDFVEKKGAKFSDEQQEIINRIGE